MPFPLPLPFFTTSAGISGKNIEIYSKDKTGDPEFKSMTLSGYDVGAASSGVEVAMETDAGKIALGSCGASYKMGAPPQLQPPRPGPRASSEARAAVPRVQAPSVPARKRRPFQAVRTKRPLSMEATRP